MDEDREGIKPPPLPHAANMKSQRPEKLSCKARNDQMWNSHKDEIHQMYIVEDKTLTETMDVIQQKHAFEARFETLACCRLHVSIFSCANF